MHHQNFNPIIVLFLTSFSPIIRITPLLFQSYYSLISNVKIEMYSMKNIVKFQSYYSLISNTDCTLKIDRGIIYFNPIIVLFLTHKQGRVFLPF